MKKIKWTQVKQDAFKEIKRIMARDTLLPYLGSNEHLNFIIMLARSNWGRLSDRKANRSLSTIGNLLIHSNSIQ